MRDAVPPLQATLAKNLSRAMSHRGMNDRDVEAKCGVAHKTVNNMRNNRHHPELDNVEKVAQALQMQPWMLLVPGFDERPFTDDDLKRLVENYASSDVHGRGTIASVAENAASAATQRKAG